MTAYIIVGAVVTWVLGWVWFSTLFPKVREELQGGAGGGMGRAPFVSAIALIILAASLGTFIKNRNVLDFSDTIRLGFKVWFGFLLPVIAVSWATGRRSVNALVAMLGYWLLSALVLAALVDWMLLR